MGLVRPVAVAVAAILFVHFSPLSLDFEPVYHDIPFPNFEGPYAPNDELSKAKRAYENVVEGPEALVVGPDGHIYTGLTNGHIVRLVGNKVQPVAKTGVKDCAKESGKPEECGRPLGLRFGKDGLLYMADAYSGILTVDITSGKVTTLVPLTMKVDGKSITFPDDLDVDKNGVIYFSDASTRWNLQKVMYSVFERQSDGRVLKYDPKTKKVEVLVDNMAFPNGVQLDKDENSLLIAECSLRRIIRYYLKGPKSGQREVLLDQMPGLPDNIRPSSRGGYWIGIAAARNQTHRLKMDFLGDHPVLLRLYVRVQYMIGAVAKFLDSFIPNQHLKDVAFVTQNGILLLLESGTSMIVEMSEGGKVLRTLHATYEQCGHISHVLEHKGTLYLGSFMNKYVTVLKEK